jgi:hypothetical protein
MQIIKNVIEIIKLLGLSAIQYIGDIFNIND